MAEDTTRPVALVTGASSGIGAEFARALAVRAHDLVLVARSEARLQELAATLTAEHGAAVEVLSADLETEAGIAAVEARLGDPARPVELLVNNAAFGTHGGFHELPIESEVAQLQLNIVALVRLTHAALGPMVQRTHGGVINVSSIGAYQPTPHMATYSASKAFVSSFTNAIHEELKDTGVKAMVLAPGYTHTEFHLRAQVEKDGMPGFIWQTPDEVVDAALRAYARGRAVCIPGALNHVAAAFSSTMPAAVTRRIASMFTSRQ